MGFNSGFKGLIFIEQTRFTKPYATSCGMYDLITTCKLILKKFDYVNVELNICNKIMPVPVCLSVTVINYGNVNTEV